MCLYNFFVIQAEQSKTFSQNIKNDIVDSLKAILAKQLPENKKLSQMGREYDKLNAYMSKFGMLREGYIKNAQELQQLNKSKNVEKLETKYQEKQEIESQFKNFLKDYNQVIEDYFCDISKVNDTFMDLEVKRREYMKDSVMKYLVYQVSVTRNLQYDIDRITQRLEAINIKDQLYELFKEQPSDK